MEDIFKPSSLTIKQLFGNTDALYQIPRYQRAYSWGDNELDKLWDDIIEAKQNFRQADLSNFILRIQVSMDAKLVEVISYQGEKALPFFMKVSMTQSKDEKLQQNRFLTEWLESIFISGISTSVKF